MANSSYQIDPDAILESVIEIRFDPAGLPEVTLGRILSSEALQDLQVTRLPEADIPYSAREADRNLFYKSMYQLDGKDFLVRVGLGSLSVHMTTPYPGWDAFSKKAEALLQSVWDAAGRPVIARCSLRYINALTSSMHGVNSIDDLNLKVNIGSKNLLDLSVSFSSENEDKTEAFVRVASAKHVSGNIPEDTSFVVDIDVRIDHETEGWDISKSFEWLSHAREIKNAHFFELLPSRIVESLKAD
jgi:uncharacterized protein (TIGR04255 family)